MENKEEYILLIQKQLSGEITPEEKTELDKQIYSSAENEKIYKDLVKVWNDIIPPFEDTEFNTTNGWNKLSEELNFRSRQNISGSSFNFNKWYGIAASFLLILSLSIYYYVSGNEIVYFNDTDSILKVKLPDNSVVQLNKNSEIRFDWNDTPETRNIELTGEAFFNVTKDTAPFIVKTFNSQVKVLGTSFNVKSVNEVTILTVKSGRVEFSSVYRADLARIIVRNQQSICGSDKKISNPVNVNADTVLSWIKGNFDFRSITFKEVLSKLQEKFEFKYKIDDLKLLDKKITASFDDKTLDVIIESICSALDLQYKKEDNLYSFFKNSTN